MESCNEPETRTTYVYYRLNVSWLAERVQMSVNDESKNPSYIALDPDEDRTLGSIVFTLT